MVLMFREFTVLTTTIIITIIMEVNTKQKAEESFFNY